MAGNSTYQGNFGVIIAPRTERHKISELCAETVVEKVQIRNTEPSEFRSTRTVQSELSGIIIPHLTIIYNYVTYLCTDVSLSVVFCESVNENSDQKILDVDPKRWKFHHANCGSPVR